MEKSLFDYQEDLVTRLSTLMMQVLRAILQLATGGGKTVIFSAIVHRFTRNNPANKVLILVHRDELMAQARNTMYEWYGIIPELMAEGSKRKPTAQVCIAMVETANNRLKKDPAFFKQYTLAIVDEAHLGNHHKVIQYLQDHARIIGCTATPISSNKKKPLKDTYQGIICGPQINDLIERQALLSNCTYRPKTGVDLSDFTIANGGIRNTAEGVDFDKEMMAARYKSAKHVINTITQYKQKAYGKKTIIFNCNVEHSLLVMQAFRNEGVPCRHLDGNTSKDERKEILRWFKNTHNAVLCNVGVATTGFDEKSVYCVILNRDTLSLSLYLQMCGRGGRTFPGMDHFVIIDMGGNTRRFGDWSDDRDWEDVFWNPDEPKKSKGVPPMKECPKCEALLHASARMCSWCGFQIPVELVLVDEIIEFELLKDAKPPVINVEKIIDDNPGVSEYRDLHLIKNKIIGHARNEWKVNELTSEKAYSLYNTYMEYVKEWFKAKGKRLTDKAKAYNNDIFFKSLKEDFGYEEVKEQMQN